MALFTLQAPPRGAHSIGAQSGHAVPRAAQPDGEAGTRHRQAARLQSRAILTPGCGCLVFVAHGIA